jgi:fructosamine-3-kinase
LDHMLSLTSNVGMSDTDIESLRQKVRSVLKQHSTVQPSLVHGDLWGGNKGFCRDGPMDSQRSVPCIFDPAAYYGDREVDIAMTHVFGGFNKDFYNGYESVWPLSEGHEKRRVIYNLYHILNHDVLFGGGYRSQARSMIYEILRS